MLLPLQPHEKPGRGKELHGDILKYLRIAQVVRVDYETGWLDIEWTDANKVNRSFIFMPTAYSSPRASIRGMPETGSLVVCGWFRGQSQTLEDPIILSFLDMNLDQLLQYNLLRNQYTPETLAEIQTIREKIGYNVIRAKRRKIYPGEIQIESSPGAELYLDEDVYLSDSRLNEIEIRSADKSIRLSSNQYYSITQASRIWNGMVIREPGNQTSTFQQTVLPNGQKVQFITDSNEPFHLGGQAFTEHRTELFEKGDGILKVTEVNSGYEGTFDSNPDIMKPYITCVLGTLVGNDKSDLAKYSKVLRPQVFSERLASDPSIDYLECTPTEYDYLASTFNLKFNSTDAQIDIDKEGHLFTYFPASTAKHPLGAGRSWEAAFDGSVKFVVGAESIEGRSIFLDTKGGVKSVLGFDKDGRSQVTIAKKGIYIETLDKADDGTSFFLKTKGDYKGVIDGNFNLEVTGNYVVTVHGKIQEEILGTKVQNFVNDYNNLYGGSYKKIVIKDKQETIGYNKVVKITGNLERSPGVFTPAAPTETVDELDITVGSKVTTLTAGNIEEDVDVGDIIRHVALQDTVGISDQVDVGNIEQSVTTGDFKDSVTTGDFSIDVDAGNISIQTEAGTITVNAVAQTVDIDGLLTVTIKSGIQVNITAPLVALGQTVATMGGVVTGLPGIPSVLDYLTGLPFVGSVTVQATI